jgi:hypothetical protein
MQANMQVKTPTIIGFTKLMNSLLFISSPRTQPSD